MDWYLLDESALWPEHRQMGAEGVRVCHGERGDGGLPAAGTYRYAVVA